MQLREEMKDTDMKMFKFRIPKFQGEKKQDGGKTTTDFWVGKFGKAPEHLPPARPVPPKTALKPLRNLNSTLLRALENTVPGVAEIREVLAERKPSLLPEFDHLVESGRRSAFDLIQAMQVNETSRNLDALDQLAQMADAGRAGALLPVPPHITDPMLYRFDPNLVLVTADHLPRHLDRMGFRHAREVLPQQLKNQFAAVEAFLLEGFMDHHNLLLRKSTIFVLQILDRELRLFVHCMPHLPHHEDFQLLTVAPDKVTELL